jgi:acetylornithine/succinyldiaminopimelate/putrescine aminotransferase
MYANAITNTVVHPTKMPMFLKNDREAIAAAIKTCNEIDRNKPKVVRIKNTLHMSEIYISEALLKEARENPDIEVLEEPRDFQFNDNGDLF